jgi:quinol monooxygenase YgiN
MAESSAADGCTAKALEADSEVFVPLSGPGVDFTSNTVSPPEAGTSYMVGVTYLRLAAEPAARQLLGELTQPIVAQLAQQPGLVAFQIVQSARCGTARTLTVWRDEESLIDFVASPAHLAAMRRRSEVSSAATSAHYLAKDASELTIQHALKFLAAAY